MSPRILGGCRVLADVAKKYFEPRSNGCCCSCRPSVLTIPGVGFRRLLCSDKRASKWTLDRINANDMP